LGGGEGDGRSFDSDSDPAKSRAYFYLHLDDQGKLQNVEPPYWNTSCAFGACFKALEENINFTAIQDPDTGEIYLSWDLTNGVSSHAFKLSEEIYDAEAELGSLAGGSQLVEAGGRLIPAINGELKLSPTMLRGNYDLSYVNRDPFPRLEIYNYYNGELRQTITQLPERGAIGDLGPMIWLNPLAPNEIIVR
jgi:hypothetical protein